MNHRETQARKTYQDAQRAVIKACEDLREAEMFLDSFERSERSAVGGAAARVVSSADVANTHASNIREQVQPSKVLHTDSAPEEYAESRLLEAGSALQKAIGVSRVIVPADRGEMAESILLSVAEDLNRAVEALGYPTLQVMLGDDVPISQLQHSLMRMSCVVAEKYCSYVENGLRVHASGESGVSTCAECRQAESR